MIVHAQKKLDEGCTATHTPSSPPHPGATELDPNGTQLSGVQFRGHRHSG